MLSREDKARLPVALIPNSVKNDLCSSLGIMTIDHALEYIIKGETVRIDTVKVLIDDN